MVFKKLLAKFSSIFPLERETFLAQWVPTRHAYIAYFQPGLKVQAETLCAILNMYSNQDIEMYR